LICFSEIFVQQEYDQIFRKIPIPTSWIDIGCNCGYFTLWLIEQLTKTGLKDFNAMLIEPDPIHGDSIKTIIKKNNLDQKVTYYPKAVSSKEGTVEFIQRDFMFSTLRSVHSSNKQSIKVESISQEQILNNISDIDLLKIDIEGAEFEFIQSYSKVIENSKHVAMEWHSWHSGRGGKKH
tara:strand:+ start:13648 stop:14184 length:537 start_codon:yes stop_codon:yes gene_type:complete